MKRKWNVKTVSRGGTNNDDRQHDFSSRFSAHPTEQKLSKRHVNGPFETSVKVQKQGPYKRKFNPQSNKAADGSDDQSLSRHKLKKEVKVLWETLRRKKLESADHSRIASAILDKIKGKEMEMVNSHVMSRVLQTCLKFCGAEERASVYAQLRPHMLDMAQNIYSHHLVLKMLDQAAADEKSQLHKMIASLHGHVVAFLRHPVASAVVEHAYRLSNSIQKQELVTEFFSPEFGLFKGLVSKTPCRLVDLLAQEPPSKRRSVLEYMTSSLQPILEKGILDHSIIHRVLTEYLSIAGKSMAADLLQQISGSSLIRMIHTREGAKIGVTCVSRGSRKERKKIIKALKGNAAKVACDAYGCLVLIAILDIVDDTEMLNKFIVNELVSSIEQIAFDRHGRRIFLHLLSPQKANGISADALTPLEAGNCVSDEDNEENTESKEELVKASKKDPYVRRKELLTGSCLGEKLVDLCIEHAGYLLGGALGKDLIYEVAKGGHDGVLWHVVPAGICKLHQAIADIGANPRAADFDEEHIFEQYHASRTIRRLIIEPTMLPNNVTARSFARVLWDTTLKGNCMEWATGHSQKIVTAFQICDDKLVRKEAMKELKPLIDSGLLKNNGDLTEVSDRPIKKKNL
ncbi:hypothetical protein KP509_08G042900 [Ceratopteris richardii]|uniref:PUM-HD domain-containing protein n=1 Tax=Ceratopteris richardii TaxID=49495 RepID=A0A8T2U7I4_CERRI|nr:hypothetical protein KP509_08G042900 [Ceratopteris richardii]